MGSLYNENHIFGRLFIKIIDLFHNQPSLQKIACFVLNRTIMHRTFHICS